MSITTVGAPLVKFELKPFHALTPFDDMVSVTSNGVIVAIPETAVDAIGNLAAAGFTIESCELFDDTSNVG